MSHIEGFNVTIPKCNVDPVFRFVTYTGNYPAAGSSDAFGVGNGSYDKNGGNAVVATAGVVEVIAGGVITPDATSGKIAVELSTNGTVIEKNTGTTVAYAFTPATAADQRIFVTLSIN